MNGTRLLSDVDFAPEYRSGGNDVVKGFYVPAFGVATTYRRAVGYFTSTSMSLVARGLDHFEQRGGSIQIVASPHLDHEDIDDINRGYDVRAVIERATLRAIELEDRDALLDGLSVVGRLIASGQLDIKLAFIDDSNGFGLYHEKIGYFGDSSGDVLSFTGSANETYGGMVANFESVQVYRSWLPEDHERAIRIKSNFDSLWVGATPKLSIVDFPAISRERLISLARERPSAHLAGREDALSALGGVSSHRGSLMRVPPGLDVRPYQREAVDAWLTNHGRGMFKMATGTGKTKTALVAANSLATALRGREQPLVILIVAPLTHLVDQWLEEVRDFGVEAIGVYENAAVWLPRVQEQLASSRLGQRPVVAMVATNASFATDRFQYILNNLDLPLLLIADEAHNLGSKAYSTRLPPNATYRLGLSATPERWFDDEGTQALVDYFGPAVYELGLGKAIELGALCRYTYTPRIVELSDDETSLYLEITSQIAPLLLRQDSLDVNDDSQLGLLLRRRAGVLGHATAKLAVLESDIRKRSQAWFQLVYCAEGRRPIDSGYADEPSQVAQVVAMIGNDLRLTVQKYVAETSRSDRKRLLERFGSGDDLRFLAAMRCLDEGVDIPDARVAYMLASSSNPRQFIQRRGRILRRAPGKTFAEIIDYVVVPSPGAPVNLQVERRLIARELARTNEFGKLSENYGTTLEILRPYKQQYQLMDL